MELFWDLWYVLVAWFYSNDPLKLGVMASSFLPWLAYWWPAIVLGLLVPTALLLSKHSTIAVWTPSIGIGQWFARHWAKTPFAKRKRERDMRMEEDRRRHFDLMEDVAGLIEDKVDDGIWTRLDADVEYTKLKKRFPEFARCVNSKEDVREYFKKLREDNQGALVVVFPSKGGANAPTMRKHQK